MTVYSIYSHRLTGPVEININDLGPVEQRIIEELLARGGYPDPVKEGKITIVRSPAAKWTCAEHRQWTAFEMARMMLPGAEYGITWRDGLGMEMVQLFPSKEMFDDFAVPDDARWSMFYRIDDGNRGWVAESIAEVLAKYKERQRYYILKGIY